MKYYKDQQDNIYIGDKADYRDTALSEKEIADFLNQNEKKFKYNSIKQKLNEIDLLKIRPLSEITNPDILDKKYSNNKIKELEIEAGLLREELKKYE